MKNYRRTGRIQILLLGCGVFMTEGYDGSTNSLAKDLELR
jgi:hypothetical protein